MRQLLRALKRGETVGLLPDQVPPHGQGVWAPFFGEPAYTMTLAARLAAQTGARVLLLWCERRPHGAGYVVRVQPLVGDIPAGDEAAAACLNAAMEGLIRQHPDCGPLLPPLEIGRRKIRLCGVIGKVNVAD